MTEQKKPTRKKTVKKNSKMLYHVSWCGTGAEYSRCFNTEKERDYFIKNYIGTAKVNTWESEVNNE